MGNRGVALLQGTCVLLISFRVCQPLGLGSEWGGVRRAVRFWLVAVGLVPGHVFGSLLVFAWAWRMLPGRSSVPRDFLPSVSQNYGVGSPCLLPICYGSDRSFGVCVWSSWHVWADEAS